ncbi:MAG: DUF305 domain-containing protein [Anaerolineae bacterium]|nr:DUF305 domain-containing protein [Anaerolineae bacterium]
MEDHSDQAPLEEQEARTNRVWWALGIVGVLAAFGLGFLIARFFQPSVSSADIAFAQNMTVHHSQAVEMATYLHDRTNDEGLKTMAYDIMLSQQGQIGMMQGWLEMWGQPAAAPIGQAANMMGMATQEQVNALKTLPSPALEKQFLTVMIRHHEGGVTMAQEELQKGSQPIVKRLADNIVKGQQAEIDYMKGLLEKSGSAPLPEVTPMPMDHSMPTPAP